MVVYLEAMKGEKPTQKINLVTTLWELYNLDFLFVFRENKGFMPGQYKSLWV